MGKDLMYGIMVKHISVNGSRASSTAMDSFTGQTG